MDRPMPQTDRPRDRMSPESGLTLAAVIILTVVIVSFTSGLITLGLSRHRESEQSAHRLRALNAAEAGLATVTDRIWREYRFAAEDQRVDLVDGFDGKYDTDDRIAYADVAFGLAIYDASVTSVVRDGTDHADVRIQAIGTYRNASRTITAVVRFGRRPSHVFNYAYFVNNFGWMWGSGVTVNGDVCSNGDFSLRDATINGDIYASRNDRLGSLGTITGDSVNDGLESYRADASDRARPASPTSGDTAGEDANGNGIPDAYEYPTGYDGESDRFEGRPATEMPYLGRLETHAGLASRKGGTLRKNDSLIVDGIHDGTLVIEGTTEHPIVIDGPVVIRGDVVLKGVISGKGTIYAGRNVHVAGNLEYATPPTWPKPSTDPTADATANQGADLVGLVARGSVILGDYTNSGWTGSLGSYLEPPFTQSYEVPSTDADIGYVTGTNASVKPVFHGDYTAIDGGKKTDGTDRRFYESSLTDAEFAAFADPSVTRIDGIYYTNHLFAGRVGQSEFNGTIVARDEAVLYSTSITMNYDVRVHSDGYEAIDIYLPRAPMRKFLLWQEGT